MFKSMLVIFVIAAAVGRIEAKMTMDEARQAFLELGKTCVEETGATPEEVAELKTHEPESKGAKCLAACLFRNMGIIKEGKYDAAGVIVASKMIHDEGSPEHEKVKEIAEACAVVVDDDECELAAKAIGCQMPKFAESGVELPM